MANGTTVKVVCRALLAMGLVSRAFAQNAGQSPPVVPAPGQAHIPPNTRVIEGVVHDANGAPFSGAIVLLKDTKTLQIRSYITQQDGSYHFYGLSTDVNYQVRAQSNDMTSPGKLVSVFDSHKFIKVNLKLKDKKKPYPK
ncbi:MAG: carboxypeptidase regulatory-like domain-containing protein [Acidobacteriaceae bacterium]|nr:carboxypeptidase regulatory-like domain-containing protein [Acidobacteriaceae bacterium]